MSIFSALKTFTAFSCFLLGASALELHTNGSYSIKIGVMYNASFPDSNISPYVKNIRNAFTKFSTKLFISTKEKFFLESVEILEIPVIGNETPSFQAADIRVSDTFQVPRTENPNICGQPGEYIELPLNFFESQNGGPYGDNVKALLALWARFRWGVWEEHGFIGDEKYPYFYKETEKVEEWSMSGCSNVPLVGDVVNQYDEISEECNITNIESLPDICRFKPNPSKNTATSSLMHIHFLDTVTEFCDNETHDRNSPNRQNLFCGYKSIWEIIPLTPDFMKVTRTGTIDVPVVRFQETKKSQDPVLYVLLDKSQNLVKKIADGLMKILNGISPDTITALGTFPSESIESYVTEAVSWTPFGDKKSEFENVIRAPPTGEDAQNNFGFAIQEATEAIRRQDTLGGAVLLIVKLRATANSFSDIAVEEEVLADLRSTQLKVVSIELTPNDGSYKNLADFAKEQTIRYEHITPGTIDSVDYFSIARDITNALDDPTGIPAPEKSTVIYNGILKPFTKLPVMIQPHIKQVHFRLTAPAAADPRPTGRPGESFDNPREEWGEGADSTRRVVVGKTLPTTAEQIQNGFEWSYDYNSDDSENTESHLLIFGVYEDDTPISEVVQVTVFTSASDNLLNFNHTANSESPFTIFARVTLKEAPVTNLTVTAVIRNKTGPGNWSVNLYDGGHGNPDVLRHDGIYSGSFIPPTDGAYTISILVKNEVPNTPKKNMRRFQRPSDLTRLIPINQAEFDCEDVCGLDNALDYVFQMSADLPGTLSVVNRDEFIQFGKPMKIFTLEENKNESNGEFVRLKFNKPGLLGGNSQAEINYSIYVVKNKADLYNESALTPNSTEINPTPGEGIEQEISVPLTDVAEPDDFFIAIKAHNGVLVSALSNIIAVHFDPFTTTPTPASTESTIAITSSTDPSDTTPTAVTGTGPTGGSTGVTDPPSGSSSTEPPPTEEDKPFFKTGAGIAVIVLIVVIGVAVLGGGAWYCMKRSKGSRMESA